MRNLWATLIWATLTGSATLSLTGCSVSGLLLSPLFPIGDTSDKRSDL